MRHLLLNGVVILLVASPLLLLQIVRPRSIWVDRHHDGLALAVWFITLAAVYVWVLPLLGLQPNMRFFEP
jgi:hypothetical protein